MYAILVRLILLAALMELGVEVSKIRECPSRACSVEIERASRKVLKIDWKPISVFPEQSRVLDLSRKAKAP